MYECSPLYNFRTERRQCTRFENSLENTLKTKLSLTISNNNNNNDNNNDTRKRSDITNSKGEIHKVDIKPYHIEGWDSRMLSIYIYQTII